MVTTGQGGIAGMNLAVGQHAMVINGQSGTAGMHLAPGQDVMVTTGQGGIAGMHLAPGQDVMPRAVFANGEAHTSLVNGPGPFARSWQDESCSLEENFT